MEIPLQVIHQDLFCPPGQFFIDEMKPADICIVTHAHGDHASFGHKLYIGTEETIAIIKRRMRKEIPARIVKYGEKIRLNQTWVSLHPAGHILGSSQVRIETDCITVVSGDYKRVADPTCQPFEPIKCDIFVTESTFALPIYQWPDSLQVANQILHWWESNAANGHPSLLFCYSLGKAQRLLSLLSQVKKETTVYLHGAMLSLCQLYQERGIAMTNFKAVAEMPKGTCFSQELILAPPSALGTAWVKRFPSFRTAFASGWMAVRGTRRRKALDRGFILSDHADWQGLIKTILETEAKIILTTHGNCTTLAHFLREKHQLDARELKGLEYLEESEE